MPRVPHGPGEEGAIGRVEAGGHLRLGGFPDDDLGDAPDPLEGEPARGCDVGRGVGARRPTFEEARESIDEGARRGRRLAGSSSIAAEKNGSSAAGRSRRTTLGARASAGRRGTDRRSRNGWTIADVVEQCDGGYEPRQFVWARGVARGAPLPELDEPEFAPGEKGPIFARSANAFFRLEDARWVPLDGAPEGKVRSMVASASGTLLVQISHDAAGDTLHARDAAGKWTVVTLDDPSAPKPYTIDFAEPIGGDLYVSISAGKPAVLFHDAM